MQSSLARDRHSKGSWITLLLMLSMVGCATGGKSTGPEIDGDSAGGTAYESEPGESSDTGEPDASPLVAEALEACEVAEELWQQGDLAGSLATLDEAYEILLQIPDDSSHVQQKDELRHLISRRVVEIYRSQLTAVGEPNSEIPLDLNEYVQYEIKRFTGPERKFFLDSYRRSGRYRPMIVRKLREAGLPEELSWLPLVESGFKNRALSRARALGMWQFISSTGTHYGLERSHWVDERMDPEKSTDAAIAYLTDLHGMFGDWMMALAGYNCGEHRVMRLIRRQETEYLDGFWDLFRGLPRETARYVPRFLATVIIINDPEKYGMELPELEPSEEFETVAVERHLRLSELERTLGLEKNAISGLNPELRRGTTPAQRYPLRVPSVAAATFEAQLAAMPAYVPPAEPSFVTHRVNRGETLSTIARRYRTSVNEIVRVNHLRSRNRIRQGQRLKIPTRGGAASVQVASSGSATSLSHTVRQGDSLWRLASRYGTTVDRIKSDNGLRGDTLSVGQRLAIRTGSDSGSRSYAVRRGDTIARIAAARNVSVDAILRENGLSRSSTIYPGQVIRLPE